MTREQFEAQLIKARDDASLALMEFGMEQITEGVTHDAKIDDLRGTWHAAEVALAVLYPRVYQPKAEAIVDMRRILAWVDGEDDDE
jgi:hypothetical protein